MESFNEPIDQYIQGHKKEWYFRELMEKFRMEKGFDSFGMICLEAEINRDALYKVMRFATGTYNRDMLWALAVVMGLTLEETEMLFNSCGMTNREFLTEEEQLDDGILYRLLEWYYHKHRNGGPDSKKMLLENLGQLQGLWEKAVVDACWKYDLEEDAYEHQKLLFKAAVKERLSLFEPAVQIGGASESGDKDCSEEGFLRAPGREGEELLPF